MRDKPQHRFITDKPFAPQSLDSSAPLSVLLPQITRGIDEASPAYLVMRAAVTGDVAALNSALAQPHALPDFANDDGISPLMVAAARGHVAVVDALAAHPLVNLARADDRGWTALHFAAWLNRPDTVTALLAHHAPPLQKNTDGKTPFDLAKGHDAEEAFWQDRNFARLVKRPAPVVEQKPVEAEAPALKAAPAAAPAAPTPQAPGLKDAFIKAITDVSLEWQKDPRLNVRRRVHEELAKLDAPTCSEMQKSLGDLQDRLDWKLVFIEAARIGNTNLMCHLHNQNFFQADILNRALAATIEGGDNRDAAHHLLRWRAEPNAALPVEGVRGDVTLHRAAYLLARSGIFEEMMTFAGPSIPEKDILEYSRSASMKALWMSIDKIMKPGSMTPTQIARVKQVAGAANKTISALEIQAERQSVKGMRTKPLREKFNAAVEEGKIARVMAAYVESREDRFFRGMVEFDSRSTGGAIAVALLHEKYEFARMLIADGHSMNNAPMWLRHKLDDKGTEKAKQFAADHMSGKLKPVSITSVGRMRANDVMVYPMYGRGYYGI